MAKKALISIILGVILSLPLFVLAQSNYVFTISLYRGSRHEQVTLLQRCLAGDPDIYPEALTTGFFGSLTEKAVQRFQARHNIINYGTALTTGYGFVGPKTRAVLNLLCVPQVRITPPPLISPQPVLTPEPEILDSAYQIRDTFLNFNENIQLDTAGPGNCRTFKECESFCTIAANYQTCLNFKKL